MKVSPTERRPYSQMGESSPIPERYGVDFWWVANAKTWGVQRKIFPNDFLASLHDGRLTKELAQMQQLDHGVVLLEGMGTWTDDGMLVDNQFHLGQLYGWMMSCFFEMGVPVFRVKSQRDALHFIDRMEAWSKRKSHWSLSRRPKVKSNMWGEKGNREFGIHLLQSFEGIGPSAAEAIYDHFGQVPMEWSVDEGELMKVKGIGKKTAEGLLEAI
jgi:ERCC4-type nuclease